jgi:hypothetical protein
MRAFAEFFSRWTEGWRVIGRFIWFQIVYSLFLIPLTIVAKVVAHYIPIDSKQLAPGPIVILLLGLLLGLLYLPLAFYFASDATGYLKRRAPRNPWEHDTPDA